MTPDPRPARTAAIRGAFARAPAEWGVFAAALLLRLLYLLEIRGSLLSRILVGDARQYDLWAQSIAHGEFWGHQVFYQAPVYPYFLGVLYALFGHHLDLVRLVQILIGSGACALLARAGTIIFGRRAGVAAGLLLALYPPAIFFDALVQKTVLDSALLTGVLWSLARVLERPDRGRLLAAGAFLGALSLSRENALVLYAVIAPWLVLRFRSGWRRGWSQALVFTAGLGLVLGTVAVRNRVAGGEFALTTSQLGPNLYIGNNPEADGRYVPLRPGRADARYEKEDATGLAEAAMGHRLSPGEVSRYWTHRALEFVRAQPRAWGRLLLRKFALLWNAPEIADTEAMESYADSSLLLRTLGRIFHFGILVPLALAGVFLTAGRRRQIWFLHGILVAFSASLLLFFIFARYREPMVPVLMLFAGATVAIRPEKAFLRRPRRWLAIAGVILVAVTVNRPFANGSTQRALSYYAAGAEYLDARRYDEAAACMDRAVAANPEFASGWTALGLAKRGQGHASEAMEAVRRALRLDPGDSDAQAELGSLLFDAEDFHGAAAALKTAIEAQPGRQDLWGALGGALAADGQFAEAVVPLQKALSQTPDDGQAELDLGFALLQAGRPDDAAPHLERATTLSGADQATALSFLGQVRESQGRKSEALEEYRRALALKPDYREVEQRIEAMER